MNRILLGLGSNTSFEGRSSLELLGLSCAALQKKMENMVCSSVYRTKAMYVSDQSDFYNMAVVGMMGIDNPYELLDFIHDLETSLGRNRCREIRFGPRSMDIDIELFGNITIDQPDLQIPHPRLPERAFILVPALEILTENADSIEREIFSAYLQKLPDQDVKPFMSSTDFRNYFFPEAVHGTE